MGSDLGQCLRTKQALAALLDDESMRVEALKNKAVATLVSLVSQRCIENVDARTARDVCLALSKLVAEDNPSREWAVSKPELLDTLQGMGACGRTEDNRRSAVVAWGGLTRSHEYGNLCFNMVGWPDFADGLNVSYTVPAFSED